MIIQNFYFLLFLQKFLWKIYLINFMKSSNLSIPLVSVYIVNHNYGDFLEIAINSVLNQTLTNYEIILLIMVPLIRQGKLEGFYSNPKIRIILQKTWV